MPLRVSRPSTREKRVTKREYSEDCQGIILKYSVKYNDQGIRGQKLSKAGERNTQKG